MWMDWTPLSWTVPSLLTRIVKPWPHDCQWTDQTISVSLHGYTQLYALPVNTRCIQIPLSLHDVPDLLDSLGTTMSTETWSASLLHRLHHHTQFSCLPIVLPGLSLPPPLQLLWIESSLSLLQSTMDQEMLPQLPPTELVWSLFLYSAKEIRSS